MGGKSYTKTSRCWPGFEPVPGKSEHEEGSCRKKAPSKNGGKDVDREKARKKQIARGGERARQAKTKSPDAAERRSASKAARKSTKKASGSKSTAKKTSVRKTAAKRAPSKKSTSKKSTDDKR